MKGREDSLSVFMEHALEIIGTLVGLLYLWLEYRASIYLWIAGIIMPAVYIFVYYDAGLYADFGINIYYLGGCYRRVDDVEIRYVSAPEDSTAESPGAAGGGQKNRRTEGTPHYADAGALSAAADCHIRCCPFGHCVDIGELHGQQCALAGLFHHCHEHHRHVDAGTEICGTMVGMDCGGCSEHRAVHLQRTRFYGRTIRPLYNYSYLWLLQMEENDEQG